MTRDERVERFDASALGAFDIASAYLGLKLGFYRSPAEQGPATVGELALRSAWSSLPPPRPSPA